MDGKDVNDFLDKPLVSVHSPEVENIASGDEESDTKSLLPPKRDGISRKLDKSLRKVKWNDRHGNKLAEVLEFEPSDVSDSDDDDDDSDFCFCTIM